MNSRVLLWIPGIIILLCCLALSSLATDASGGPDQTPANPYIHSGSIGIGQPNSSASSKESGSLKPIASWVGERFIFLPQPKPLQSYGYQTIHVPNEPYQPLKYEDYVGKIARVTAVKEVDAGWEVRFELDGGGQVLIGTAYLGCLHGVAPIADIDDARAKWLGKTLWLGKKRFQDSGLYTYNSATDKVQIIPAKNLSPVKVVEVTVGNFSDCPVRFILQTSDGRQGFRDLSYSGTNGSSIASECRFGEILLTVDPRTKYQWSDKVWRAIEDEEVFIGMTAEQVVMSWGQPNEVNTTTTEAGKHEQWVYPESRFVYVDNRIVTAIQDRGNVEPKNTDVAPSK